MHGAGAAFHERVSGIRTATTPPEAKVIAATDGLAAQRLGGGDHSSIETTLRYSYLTPDVRRASVRLLNGIGGAVREPKAG